MKAVVLRSYGSPGQLRITDVDTPVPAADEVLVRVRATSVNPYDWHHVSGEPYVARLMPGSLGLRGPRIGIPGCDMAGQVEAVGADVTEFRPGDDVYALLSGGGFAEYVSVRQDLLAPKPVNLGYEQAAAVPMAAVTALLGLHDVGGSSPASGCWSTGPREASARTPCRSPRRWARRSRASAARRTPDWSGRSARMRSSTTAQRTSRGTISATIWCLTSRAAARRRPAAGC
jgi:Alcohol dehydrogenase GroES-like domain